MRFEYKYVLDYLTVDQIEAKIRLHPAGFRTSFPDRIISSIYFDNAKFSSAHDNINGSPQRIKYRIRWYGELIFPIKARLEQKIKKGISGYKIAKVMTINGPEDFSLYDSGIYLQPVSLVSYIRSYYVSFSGGIRATIDREIKYKKNIDDHFWITDPNPILELKCDLDDALGLENVVDALKLRRHKNSKYLNSLLALYS